MSKKNFEIKCSDYGKKAMVPFKPTTGKPVYCRTCFSKNKFKNLVLTLTKHGLDGEMIGKEKKKTKQLIFLKNLSMIQMY